MRVSLRWLRRWVPCLSGDIDAIGDALLSLGFPVESVEMVGIPAKHLHVGKIIQFEQHPRGDRLRICQVDVGEEVPRQIVCGANNFFQEDHVAVALPGCRMPDGTVIKVADFRGVRSHGMMCSGRELGISQDGEGLLILEKEIPIGTAVSLLFPELSDVSFDLEITSNRGDCMSHLGIARELAAYYNLNLAVCPENLPLSFADEGEKEQFGSTLRIQCDCEECTQFIAWEVRGVTVKESPQWLRDDLEHIGVRPVNNVVDVTNWLLADCGQPLHAFDKDKIHGGYLYIRRAYEGEKMVAIDHRSYALQGDMMVVCDSQKPLAIAGIMGSVDGEVDEDSKNLILESAAFAAESIQCTARKLGIVSGAAQRFSRGIDEAYVHICAKKAVQMLEQICGGEAATEPAVFSRGGEKMEKKTISIDGEFVRKKLGKNVADEEIENVLRRLYFQPQGRDGHWQVFVPSFRAHDVCTSIDLLEEFIRLYGIHQLPLGDVLMRAIYGEDDESFQFQRRVGNLMESIGFCECYTYSTRSEKEMKFFLEMNAPWQRHLRISNPLNGDQTHLRFSIIPGLLTSLRHNLDNGNVATALFEVGRVWRVVEEKVLETISVAWVQMGESPREYWDGYVAPNFYGMKSIGKRIGQLAGIMAKDAQFVPTNEKMWQQEHAAQFGNLGKFPYQLQCGLLHGTAVSKLSIDVPVFGGEWIILPKFFEKKSKIPSFHPFSQFPSVSRDLAMIVPKSLAAETVRLAVEKCILRSMAKGMQLVDLWIFDLYEGSEIPEGTKSVALRFHLNGVDRTIGDGEMQEIFGKIIERISQVEGMQLRKS